MFLSPLRALAVAVAAAGVLTTTTPAFAENNLYTNVWIGDAYDVCAFVAHDNGYRLDVTMTVTGAQQDSISVATLHGSESGTGPAVELCTGGVFTPTTGAVVVLLEITYNGAAVRRYAYCTTQAGAKSCTGTGDVSM